MSLFPMPEAIGCVKCGREHTCDLSVWAQCEDCGKTVGVCLSCSRTMEDARGLLDGSMEWHQERACVGPVVAQVEQIMATMRGAPLPPARPRRSPPCPGPKLGMRFGRVRRPAPRPDPLAKAQRAVAKGQRAAILATQINNAASVVISHRDLLLGKGR